MPDQPDAVTQPESGNVTEPRAASSARACPECGTKNDPDSRFCRSCGHGLGDTAGVGRPPQAQFPPPSPAYYYAPPAGQKQSTNGFAIASMVLGIVWIYWIGSILALVFGYIAKRQIAESNGRESGGGMATAGIVLGWIGAATLIAVIVIAIIAAATSHPSNGGGYYGG